jgi:hypothetical protein
VWEGGREQNKWTFSNEEGLKSARGLAFVEVFEFYSRQRQGREDDVVDARRAKLEGRKMTKSVYDGWYKFDRGRT